VKPHFKIAARGIAAVPDGNFDPMPSGRWIAVAKKQTRICKFRLPRPERPCIYYPSFFRNKICPDDFSIPVK